MIIHESNTYTEEEIRANRLEWLEALESGKYGQTRGTLKRSEGFCCLGVVCELFDSSKWAHINNGYVYQLDGIMLYGHLPAVYQQALAMTAEVHDRCINLNDWQFFSFISIATYLRDTWNLPKED